MTIHHGDRVRSADQSLRDLILECDNLTLAKPLPLETRPSGRITLLQPHPDDVALSAGGFLARMTTRASFVTIFSESTASKTRTREDQAFARACGGALTSLGFSEHATGTVLSDAVAAEVTESVGRHITTDPLLMAPAGVSHHPDHVMTNEIASRAGCRIFWEDVAFWGIYASSVDDRVLFTRRAQIDLPAYWLIAVDITPHIATKAAMLRLYASQSSEVWRPLRYAWTAARELRAPFEYCERFFVHISFLQTFVHLGGGTLVEAGEFMYGDGRVVAAWMT